LLVAVVAAWMLAGVPGSEGAGSRIHVPIAARGAALMAPPTPTASATPATAPTDEWTQDGHDAQRSGSAAEEPAEPWALAWTWNGPDAGGGAGAHLYDAPPEARTVTGGPAVYAPAGARGLYALAKATGQPLWTLGATAFDAAPAYDPASGVLVAGGADGRLYKLEAASGRVLATYQAGAPIAKAVLLAGGHAYAATAAGALHKVALDSFAPAWVYRAGARAATPPAYSAARDRVVFATDDLYVHAVVGATGAPAWRVKPTPNAPEPGAQQAVTFERGWPVVAEQHGLVMLRLQLHQEAMYAYPSRGNVFPDDLATTRAWLDANPRYKNLLVLRLADGAEAFTAAVGYGSTEQVMSPCPDGGGGACGAGVMGSTPVVKLYPDGGEVAYVHFRSGQANPPDYRWDGHMGEMVLDGATIPGLAAGDLRFVRMSRRNGYGGTGYVDVIDEQEPLTVAGSTLFHAHWGASESVKITDRSATLGLSYGSPIQTSRHPTVIRQQRSCADFNPRTHSTSCGLTLYNDGRYWDGPGFWTYWNTDSPPSSPPAVPIGGVGYRPHHTYVSDGLMIVEGNGGELLAFRHSGGRAPAAERR
jgi:hypothetical protein